MIRPPLRIRHLYISPGHNFFGHSGQAAGTHPAVEVAEVHLEAGRGIEGDRFFDYKDNYKGQITFFDEAVYLDLCRKFGIEEGGKAPDVFRRNVVTAGYDLNSLIGKEFELQGVEFFGTEECRPCFWMNEAFAEGAHEALFGRGGLRARILTGGVLKRDAAGT